MARRGDHIRKRADGRWEGRYRIQKNDGSYKYVSIYGKSYHEVKERLILFQAGHFTVGGNKKTRLETNDVEIQWLQQMYEQLISGGWLEG